MAAERTSLERELQEMASDMPHHALLDEAITIDFMNSGDGPGTRAAVELTLDSAKALQGALHRAIEQAEEELAEISA